MQGSKFQQSNNDTVHKSSEAKRKKSSFVKPEGLVRTRGGVDRPFLIVVIILVCFGLVMVFSASFAYALSTKNDSFYFIKKQGGFALFGLLAMLFISSLDYKRYKKFIPWFFVLSAVLLILVCFVGVAEGEAQRWIYIGPVSIQPTELMKPALVMLLAHYFAINQKKITDRSNLSSAGLWGNVIPGIIIATVCILILFEHHFSGLIIVALLGVVVMYCGGALKRWIFGMIGVGGVGVLVLIMLTDYAKERIELWLHPENFEATGKIWQTNQGLTAIGSGGFLGVGIGNSYQKYSFVSQPQNDFIFTIICEELGLVGAVAVILLFAALLFRGYKIAIKAPDTWASLTVIGIVSHVTIQAIMNMLVVTNLMPNTGVSLPFISYGGSSLLVLLCEMGIVLGISRYSVETKEKAEIKRVKKSEPKNIAVKSEVSE